MRKLTVLATTATMLIALLPLAANAATIDGAAFAADCNDDANVTVSGTVKVIGGAGVIDTACNVVIADDSKLVFRDTSLTCGATCHLVIGNSGANSVVKVIRSTISVSGPLQLSAGCCSGGEVPDENGFIKVVDSFLTGSSVEVSASAASSGGKAVVRRSTLTSTSSTVSIATFSGGTTVAKANTINSAGDINISSGFGVPGTTKAKDNTFSTSGIVTITADGGTCVSSGNTPPVACS